MTPKEAAAKCREMEQACYARMKEQKLWPGDPAYAYEDGASDAWEAAAALIDQINVPQPWPPPGDVNHVLAWAAASREPRWIDLQKQPESKWHPDFTVFSVWLPMPPAPEVKG